MYQVVRAIRTEEGLGWGTWDGKEHLPIPSVCMCFFRRESYIWWGHSFITNKKHLAELISFFFPPLRNTPSSQLPNMFTDAEIKLPVFFYAYILCISLLLVKLEYYMRSCKQITKYPATPMDPGRILGDLATVPMERVVPTPTRDFELFKRRRTSGSCPNPKEFRGAWPYGSRQQTQIQLGKILPILQRGRLPHLRQHRPVSPSV